MERRGSRQKIVECAGEMFYHSGHQATSVDDILKRCGVAKSNFYYHFKSKELLVVAVLEMRTAEYETLLTQSLHNRKLEPFQRLQHFFNEICYIQEEIKRLGGCPFGNFVAGLGTEDDVSERFRTLLSATFRQIEAALQSCLMEGIDKHQFRADIPVEDLACVTLAALEGLLILAKSHRDSAVLTDGLRSVRELLKPPASHGQNS